MKRVLFLLLPLWLIAASNTHAANVDVGVNVNIGIPGIVITSPPEFLLIPALGLHISIGTPYDLFYLDGHYYHYNQNRWYRSRHYQGPWVFVDRGHLPKRMLKHEYREMLNSRDREYQEYKKDRNRHRDRYFRPEDKQENHSEKDKGSQGNKGGGQSHKGNQGHKGK